VYVMAKGLSVGVPFLSSSAWSAKSRS